MLNTILYKLKYLVIKWNKMALNRYGAVFIVFGQISVPLALFSICLSLFLYGKEARKIQRESHNRFQRVHHGLKQSQWSWPLITHRIASTSIWAATWTPARVASCSTTGHPLVHDVKVLRSLSISSHMFDEQRTEFICLGSRIRMTWLLLIFTFRLGKYCGSHHQRWFWW